MARPPTIDRRPSKTRSWIAFAPIAAAALLACSEAPSTRDGEVAVRVDRVVVDDFDTPVVVLEEEGGPRWLPIRIGAAEARSIALQMAQHPALRPNSHDLAHSLIRELEGEVERVVITELRDGTFYAELDILVGRNEVSLDARPSDAIAIALRDRAPIFVRATLFEQVGHVEAPSDPPESATERRI